MPTLFTDNFNSYSNGELQGQGSWTGSVNATVQGTFVKEGAKAGYSALGDEQSINKIGIAQTDGTIVIYVMRPTGATNVVRIVLRDEGGVNRPIFVKLETDGKAYIYAGGWVDMGAYSADTWYYFQLEWRSSDGYVRGNFNGGAPTAWSVPFEAWTAIKELYLIGTTGVSNLYFDAIQQDPITITNYTFSGSDAISLLDSLSKRVSFIRLFSDAVSLAENLSFSVRSYVVSVSERISVNEVFSKITRIWTFLTKNTASWIHKSKSSEPSWTHKSKSSEPSWTHKSKSTDPTWTHKSKSSSPTWSWRNKP